MLHNVRVDCVRVNGDKGGVLPVEVFDFLIVEDNTEGETALFFCDFEASGRSGESGA